VIDPAKVVFVWDAVTGASFKRKDLGDVILEIVQVVVCEFTHIFVGQHMSLQNHSFEGRMQVVRISDPPIKCLSICWLVGPIGIVSIILKKIVIKKKTGSIGAGITRAGVAVGRAVVAGRKRKVDGGGLATINDLRCIFLAR